MIPCAIRASDSPFDRATLLDPASDSRSGHDRSGYRIGRVEWRPNTISGSPLLFQRLLHRSGPRYVRRLDVGLPNQTGRYSAKADPVMRPGLTDVATPASSAAGAGPL